MLLLITNFNMPLPRSFKDNPIANAMEAPSDIISLKYNEPLDVIVATSYASLVYFPFFSDSFQEGMASLTMLSFVCCANGL